MKSARQLKQWFEDSRRRQQPVTAVAPVTAGLRADDLSIWFLLDSSLRVDVQAVLAALDTLVNCHIETALSIHVVHREQPCDELRAALDALPNVVLHHRSGSEFLDATADAAVGFQWRNVMALAIASRAATACYLVLDAYCMCIRPFERATWLEPAGVWTQWEDPQVHPGPLASAQSLLQTNWAGGQLLSTAPYIFSTALAKACLARLAAVASRPRGEDVLVQACVDGVDWSANALYSVSAGAQLRAFHRPALVQEVHRALHSDINLWGEDDDTSRWSVRHWVQLAGHGQFLIIKTRDPEKLRQQLSQCYALGA